MSLRNALGIHTITIYQPWVPLAPVSWHYSFVQLSTFSLVSLSPCILLHVLVGGDCVLVRLY